ncbi:MAG: hypothetical protein K8R92_10400 [Planctomycetes bacterium]|nr:hypothetical protein [Planctomycetota bacterium]
MAESSSDITWPALLARWIEFAQAAKAWPAGLEVQRLRESVASVIALQAVTHALGELDRVAPSARAFARDSAEVAIEEAVKRLESAWKGAVLPAEIAALVQEARQALRASLYAQLRGWIWEGPGAMKLPSWPDFDAVGTLAAMEPGSIVLPGEVVAWWTERDAPPCAGCRETNLDHPVQLYRMFSKAGSYLRSEMLPLSQESRGGLPMLVPLFLQGHEIGKFLRNPQEWHELQVAAGVAEKD